MAEENRRKIEEINGVLKEIHGEIAYVTLSDRHGASEDVCLDSNMFIEQDAWLPGTSFRLEYYETKAENGALQTTQEFRVLERGKESYLPLPPAKSLKEILNEIDEHKQRRNPEYK